MAQICGKERVMTQVVCSARTCEYNKDKICQLPVIELEESDFEWKDCGQGKERKANTPQTDEEYINNLPWTEKDCPWK